MKQFVALVTDKQMGGTEVLGPYRSADKASEICTLLRNPFATDFRDEDQYEVVGPVLLRKYGE